MSGLSSRKQSKVHTTLCGDEAHYYKAQSKALIEKYYSGKLNAVDSIMFARRHSIDAYLPAIKRYNQEWLDYLHQAFMLYAKGDEQMGNRQLSPIIAEAKRELGYSKKLRFSRSHSAGEFYHTAIKHGNYGCLARLIHETNLSYELCAELFEYGLAKDSERFEELFHVLIEAVASNQLVDFMMHALSQVQSNPVQFEALLSNFKETIVPEFYTKVFNRSVSAFATDEALNLILQANMPAVREIFAVKSEAAADCGSPKEPSPSSVTAVLLFAGATAAAGKGPCVDIETRNPMHQSRKHAGAASGGDAVEVPLV